MGRATRFLLKWLIILAGVGFVAVGWVVVRSPDPEYTAYEMVCHGRFHRYDAIIQDAARLRGIDPMVVKAVVWRESRFDTDKVGLDGERGLMQITNAAASEWVRSEKIPSFVPEDLFDPEINIKAGTWLLARALHRYGAKDDPLPFALAEYNAGRSRVAKWTRDTETVDPGQPGPGINSQQLQARIDIPSTRNYIETVQDRVQFYHRRGGL